jgi:hypothetical protein
MFIKAFPLFPRRRNALTQKTVHSDIQSSSKLAPTLLSMIEDEVTTGENWNSPDLTHLVLLSTDAVTGMQPATGIEVPSGLRRSAFSFE